MNHKMFCHAVVASLFCVCINTAKGSPSTMGSVTNREISLQTIMFFQEAMFSPASSPGNNDHVNGLPEPLLDKEENKPLHPVSFLLNQQGDGRAYAIYNFASKGCLAASYSEHHDFIRDNAEARTTVCYLSGSGDARNSQYPFTQFFYYTTAGQLQSASNYEFCLAVKSADYKNGEPIVFKRCDAEDLSQRFIYNSHSSQIRVSASRSYCLAIEGSANARESKVILQKCDNHANDQNWKVETPSVARIKNKAKGDYVAIDTEKVGSNKALITWPSEQTNMWLDQYWIFDGFEYKPGHTATVLSPFANSEICVENADRGYLSTSNGDRLGLLACNPKDRLDQQLIFTDDAFLPDRWGDMFMDGLTAKHVAISGSSDKAGSKLIFWTKNDTADDQKFQVDTGSGIFAFYNESKGTCLSAPHTVSSDKVFYSQKCGKAVAGRPYHNFFQALKDDDGYYIFCSIYDNRWCLRAGDLYGYLFIEHNSSFNSTSDDKFRWKVSSNRLQSVKTKQCIDFSDETSGSTGFARLKKCSGSESQKLIAMKSPVPNAGAFRADYLCKKPDRGPRAPEPNNALPHIYHERYGVLNDVITDYGLTGGILADLFRLLYQTDNSYYLGQIRNMLTQMGYAPGRGSQGAFQLYLIDQALRHRSLAIDSVANTAFGRSYALQFGQNTNPYESYGIAIEDDDSFNRDMTQFGSVSTARLDQFLMNIDGITRGRDLRHDEVERLRLLAGLARNYGRIQNSIGLYLRELSNSSERFHRAAAQMYSEILSETGNSAEIPNRETLEDQPEGC